MKESSAYFAVLEPHRSGMLYCRLKPTKKLAEPGQGKADTGVKGGNMQSSFISPEHFNPRVLYIMRRFFDARDATPCHAHDFLSLIFILNGDAQYEIGGKIYPVSSGTLFICNPEVTHHRILLKNQRIEEFQAGITGLGLKGLPANYLIPPGEEPHHTFFSYGQAFFNGIEEIMAEQQRNDEASVLMLKCIVMKLLVYIIKERYVPSAGQEKNVFFLERYDKTAMVNNILAFINENYMKPVSLAKISENTYLSPIYVSRVFKETTGESPISYLIRVRLSKACELLIGNGASIREIARQVGYEDAYYFSKLFKKYYEVSPMAYRKMKEKPFFRVPLEDM